MKKWLVGKRFGVIDKTNAYFAELDKLHDNYMNGTKTKKIENN